MRWVVRLMVSVLLLPAGVSGQERKLDSFETLHPWKAFASDGVEVAVRQVEGASGRAIAVTYRFQGGGYCGITRSLPMTLPADYAFNFLIKGTGPPNTLEVKFSDTTGENVWWKTLKDFSPSPSWERVRVRKRHIAFAWGPHPAASVPHLGRIEFVVSAGQGGSGEIVIDELSFEELEPAPEFYPRPVLTASSQAPGTLAGNAMDGDPETVWEGANVTGGDWIEWDFGRPREFGGLQLTWDDRFYPLSYTVLGSRDGRSYDTLYDVRRSAGGKRIIPLVEADARSVRLHLPPGQRPSRLRESSILPLESTLSPNSLFSLMAHDQPRGWFPKYLLKEASYWTVIGVPADSSEALMNTEAAIEVNKSRFSLEPFLFLNGCFFTWNDVSTAHALAEGDLPVPVVTWTGPGFRLETTACALGEPGSSDLHVRYVLTCVGAQQVRGRFYVAVRPFQVNPSYQWLNTRGGLTSIHRMRYAGGLLTVDSTEVFASPPPDVFGAVGFDEGDIIQDLANGLVPPRAAATDPHGFASGALGYDVRLSVGDSLVVSVVVPFHDVAGRSVAVDRMGERASAEALRFWRERLSAVRLHVPAVGSQIVRTLRSNLAYILINMDGSAIQPGSRSYERSWIRDGCLTSAALLRMGFRDEVRSFITWYAKYQYPNGKIPCVVDRRGADPVAEHDSHGQFIFAVMQYYRFTHDKEYLQQHWQAVQNAVDYIQSLRAPRLTKEFADGTDSVRAFYGLVTESISHEGYSAKPMHSYWDNFFVLRGFKDAAVMAAVLGDGERHAEYDSLARAFRALLLESLRRAMVHHGIDYLPGCVELGDFDATSTTIALYPVDEKRYLPAEALGATFDRYVEYAQGRITGDESWTAFTPYELRTVGSLILLGAKEQAHTLLDWFFTYQRPRGWNHWSEVVWRDPTQAEFVGDMPHTWVGSDFINAARAMFLYEVEEDSLLVVGSGIRESWLTESDSVWVDRLPTYYGSFGYSVTRHGDTVRVTLRPQAGFAAKGVLVSSPMDRPLRSVLVNGQMVSSVLRNAVEVDPVPAVVTFIY